MRGRDFEGHPFPDEETGLIDPVNPEDPAIAEEDFADDPLTPLAISPGDPVGILYFDTATKLNMVHDGRIHDHVANGQKPPKIVHLDHYTISGNKPHYQHCRKFSNVLKVKLIHKCSTKANDENPDERADVIPAGTLVFIYFYVDVAKNIRDVKNGRLCKSFDRSKLKQPKHGSLSVTITHYYFTDKTRKDIKQTNTTYSNLIDVQPFQAFQPCH